MKINEKIIYFCFIMIINIEIINSESKLTNDDRNKYVKLYYSERYKSDFLLNFVVVQFKFQCNDSNYDCSGNGTCLEDKSDCVCNTGFYSFESAIIKCSYSQKKKSIALVLEILIPFGFGHLYLLNYSIFLAKFLVYFISYYYVFCIMIFIGSINNSNIEEKTYIYTKRISFILLPILIAWYFFDIIWLILGKYNDGNGIILY